MSKLIISKNDLKEFSVAKFKDHEGCPDAIKLLYKRYGDRVDSLLKYKNDFLHIIVVDNKPHWPINFLCNLLTESAKLSFYENYLEDNIYYVGDKKIGQTCHKTFLDLKKNRNLKENLDSINEALEKVQALSSNTLLKVDSLEYKTLLIQQEILTSLKHLLVDDVRLFTRSMTASLTSLSNIKTILDPISSSDNQPLKSIAIDLLEYSEIF